MKQGGGRIKGATFERFVATSICKAFKVPNKCCYRTPLSGGHPYDSRADLKIAEPLLSRFPYHVECKHRSDFTCGHLVRPSASLREWLQKTVRYSGGQRSLVVVRGNRTPIFALSSRPVAVGVDASFEATIRTDRRRWWVYVLDEFLEAAASGRGRNG